MKRIILFGITTIVISLILAGCGTSEEAIQTAIAETEQAAPAEIVISEITETNTAEPEPTETTAPTKTPRPTNTPVPEPELEVTQIRNYIASTGSTYFIAIIENKGNVPVKYVKLHITIRDAEGTMLQSDSSYSELDVIPAGGYSPIDVILQDAPEFASFDIHLEYRELDDELYSPPLEILSHSSSLRSTGSTMVAGEIANNGDTSLKYVKIIASTFDSEGNFVGFSGSYSDFDEIPPGGTSPFDVIIQDNGLGAVDHYDLLASGREVD